MSWGFDMPWDVTVLRNAKRGVVWGKPLKQRKDVRVFTIYSQAGYYKL